MAGAIGTAVVRRGKRRRSRWRRALLFTAGVLIAGIAATAFLALRAGALEARLAAELAKVIARPFAFESSRWTFTGGMEVRGLRILAAEDPRPGAAPAMAAAAEPGAGPGDVFSARLVRLRPSLSALLSGRFEIERIVIEQPVVRIARQADGRWNLEGLLRAPLGLPFDPAVASRFPAVVIESGRAVYADDSTFGGSFAETAADVYLSLRGSTAGTLIFKAELRPERARKIELLGEVSFAEGRPVARFHAVARKLDLAAAAKSLPPPAAAWIAPLRPRGFVDAAGDFKYDPDQGLVPLRLTGRLLRGELSPPGWPSPIQALTAELFIKETSIEVKELSGVLGEARLSGEARAEFRSAWRLFSSPPDVAGWTAKGSLKSLPVDEKLRALIPPAFQARFDEFQPRGRAGLDFRVLDGRVFPPRPEDVSATLRLEGLDFAYRRFPYPVTDLRGDLLIEKGRVTFERPLAGRSGPIRVQVSGKGIDIDGQGGVDVTFRAEDVPLDEKFRSALPKEAHRVWDDLQLLGTASGAVSVFRAGSPPGAAPAGPLPPPRVGFTVHSRDARLNYRHFPYEIRDIAGALHFDSEARRITLDELKGRHGEHVLTGSAVIELRPPGIFQVVLESESIAVDADLVAALSENGRRLVQDFRLQGRLRARVDIHWTGKGDVETLADLELHEGSIQHRSFPYFLPLAGGRLRILGGHTVAFESVRTLPGSRPAVAASGSLSARGAEPALSFELDLQDLEFDERLMKALPADLSLLASNLNPGGVYGGKLQGIHILNAADPARNVTRYTVSGITARDASIDFGLRVHNMHATGFLAGEQTSGGRHRLAGEVLVESAWFNRIHITRGEIDFVHGDEHPAAAEWRAGKKIEGRDYTPPREMLARVAKEKVKDTFQMLLHSDDLYGGTADGFLYVDTGELGDMGGDLAGQGLQVAKASADIFGVKSTQATGAAHGRISFTGKKGDARAIRGRGEGHIEKARLLELPLFLGLLNVLFGDPSAHYFHGVALRFDIADGKFTAPADGIEIRSSAVKLSGGGTLDFRGQLDLTLQPRFLDFKIPIVEQILTLAKKGLAQIWITGDLAKPKVEFVTGAGLLRIGIGAGEKEGVPLPTDLRK